MARQVGAALSPARIVTMLPCISFSTLYELMISWECDGNPLRRDVANDASHHLSGALDAELNNCTIYLARLPLAGDDEKCPRRIFRWSGARRKSEEQ